MIPRRIYTPEEDEMIVHAFMTTGRNEVARKLHADPNSVYRRARELGMPMKKSYRKGRSRIMTDKEFLDYCEGMTDTPRCGFVPSSIARLLRLAGHEDLAKQWDTVPHRVISNCHDDVTKYVKEARLLAAMAV